MPRYINPYTDFGFKKLFGEEGGDFTPEQRTAYEQSRMNYLGIKAVHDTAKEEGLFEVAENAILEGFDNNIIARLTGLSIAQIEALRSEAQ